MKAQRWVLSTVENNSGTEQGTTEVYGLGTQNI